MQLWMVDGLNGACGACAVLHVEMEESKQEPGNVPSLLLLTEENFALVSTNKLNFALIPGHAVSIHSYFRII